MSRATERFNDKRDAILDAAARHFNRHGVKGALVADIAADVGLVTNSLAYYYRRKEDLVAACLGASMEAMGALADAAGAEPTLAGRLHRFIAGYLALLADIEAGRQAELMVFSDLLSVAPPHGEALRAAYAQLFRRVRALLGTEGEAALPHAARNARAHLLLSTTSWSRTWLSRYEPHDHAQVAARLADLLLHGLASGGREPARLDSGSTGSEPEPGADPPGAATRTAYLRAATRLVNEHGYRGASVDRIAAELQLTKGSFYHHHEAKEDLIAACFERSFAVLRRAQDEAFAASGSGLDRLALACRSLLRFQTSPRGPLLRATAWTGLPDASREAMRRTMARLGERFATLVIDGIADGSVRVVDPSMAAQVINGAVNAGAELGRWVSGVGDEEAVELYAMPLFTGLAAAR